MAQLGKRFDATGVQPQAPMEPLPTDWYAMKGVEGSIEVSNRNPDNKYIKIAWEIDESRHPQFRGRRVYSNINLYNTNPKASEIAERELAAICHAMGLGHVDDTDDLLFKPIAVRVAYRPARGEYGESNEVKGYDSIAKRFGGGPAPQQGFGSAPQQQQAGPAAGPAQASVPSTPPWKQQS